jgi:hypothetical protein
MEGDYAETAQMATLASEQSLGSAMIDEFFGWLFRLPATWG